MGQNPVLAAAAYTGWEELLQAAVVAVEVPSLPGAQSAHGTGFMIAPGIVATCAHVLADQEEPLPDLVSGRAVHAGVELVLGVSPELCFRTPAGLDLALLQVKEASVSDDLPAVLTSPVVAVGDPLWTYGHPDGLFSAGQPASLVYEGESRRSERDPLRMLRAHGTPLTKGFSGSPVVNRRTGAVCGMVCTSSATGSAHMLPVSEIVSRCEPARVGLLTAQVDQRRWLGSLTDEQLSAGKWRFPGPQVRAYLTLAARTAASHPYHLPPGIPVPPLSAVYVRQAARLDQTDQAKAGPARAQPAEIVFDGEEDAFLIGGAGAGKSSLFQFTVADLARRRRDGEVSEVPVRVQATDVLTAPSLGEAIARSVRSDFGMLHGKGGWSAEFFEQRPVPAGRWLVLVDGLDEIMDPRKRQHVLRALTERRSAPDCAHRFIIATRPGATASNASEGWNPRQYELLAFDEEQRLQLVQGWFARLEVARSEEAATQFSRELRRLGLDDLARNPLMATMLCQLFIAAPDRRLPAGRTRIFQDFVHLLRERQYSDADGGVRQQLRRALRRYGADAEQAGERLIALGDALIGRLAADRLDGDTTPAVDKLDDWTRDLRGTWVPEVTWRELLADYLRGSGLLLARRDDFVFLHQTIQEYLAAQFIPSDRERSHAVFWDLFSRTAGGKALAPIPWRQSFARFLVAAWQQPEPMAAALRSLAATGGLNGALFITAVIHDGCEVGIDTVTAAVHTLAVAARDSRGSLDDRHLAIATCLRLDRQAGLDLAVSLVTDGRQHPALRTTTLHTMASLAPSTGNRISQGADAATTAGDQWIMQQLTRLDGVDSAVVLSAVARDAAFEPRQRIWAADALARAGGDRGSRLLVDLANDTALDSAERRAAATALHALKDPRGATLLRRLAFDESAVSAERQLAARTLRDRPQSRSPVRRLVYRLGLSKVLNIVPTVSEVLEPLVATHREIHPSADVRILQQAFDAAAWWHSGQYRKSGDPYITHPLAAATILANLGMDTESLAAALLSGTVEHTAYRLEQLREEFGPEIAMLVDGIARLDNIPVTEDDFYTARKVVVAVARDPRILVIKLAQRLHNMRTLTFIARSEQERIARETLHLWTPLAHRLGMNAIKWELEDLAFGTLFPKRYEEINRLIGEHQPQREALLRQVTQKVGTDLKAAKVKAEVTGRPKHLYSIYQKMIVRGRDFNDIYDLVGVRILVDTVRDCYAALGSTHANWQPVPGRFKDYIAMPKFNMYQSLHTTVIGPTGKPVEMQIRTYAMHRTAEFGIAAHWKYKEHKGTQIVGPPAHIDEMTWLRQLLDWQREAADPSEFLDALRFDLSSQEVYVFTPKGDVIPLPTGSTPVDFAYAVHTEVGHKCIGARVNGKLVPLESTLSNGDVIEIFTSKSDTAGPTQDWLGFVKSPRARTKIRQYFNKERREEAIEAGKDAIVKAMRKQGMPLQRMLTSDALMAIARDLHLADVASLYAAVGDSQVSAQSVVQKLMATYGGEEGAAEDIAETAVATRPPRSRASSHDPGVVVPGVSEVRIRMARCCTPLPPDALFGFVTRTGVVSVHRDDCANAEDLRAQSERVVEVSWKLTSASTFLVAIQVEALDRRRLLVDVAKVLADEHVDILSATVTTTRDRVAVSRFSFEMADPKHLGHLLAAVRNVDGVFDAYRVVSGG
ncbi:RelA/SpoT family protein [Micromonospora sp. WMMC415]|nr:RelA/SpoT family protein [Micromonospora sp. WMMC415]